MKKGKITLGDLIVLNHKIETNSMTPYIEDKFPLIMARRMCDGDEVTKIRYEKRMMVNHETI